MTKLPDKERKNESTLGARDDAARLRRRLSFVVMLSASAIFVASHVNQSPATALSGKTARAALPHAAFESEGVASAQFSHTTPAHREAACASCHERTDNSPSPRVPGHKACIDCHLQQFVAAPDLPMCSICHTSLDERNPPVKAFPRLQSFNAKFDHAQHTTGGGRSEQGCAACHQPASRGVALTIPAGLGAHSTCYSCHTPQASFAGRDMASCGVCHDIARYSPTPTTAKAFRIGFSHATHGERKGLNCASCHNVRAGVAQSRQVSSTTPAQHFPPARAQSCATCHNNRRTFGGEDFSDCKKCHKGTTFRF